MARVKRGTKRRRKTKKIRDRAEGFVLGRRNQFRRMVETVRRALVYSYESRRLRKRDFRALWINRISAACVGHDISYSRLISALTRSQVGLNRKMLSEIAIHDPQGFQSIVDQVRTQAPAQ